MIIDISCDEGKGIESSHPTSIDNPAYYKDDVLHYCVEHIPIIYYKTAFRDISNEIVNYIDDFIEGTKNIVLENNTIIIDNKIKNYQKRQKE